MIRNVVIASDSFKGTLSSLEVGLAIREGVLEFSRDISPQVFSIADGGEGTVESVVYALGGEIREYEVENIFGDPIVGRLGIVGDKVILESSSPIGLNTVDNNSLDPLRASSYGLGQMIKYALDLNPSEIYIGLGGTATNDCGIGMARALGVEFLDEYENIVPGGAIGLEKIDKIKVDNLDERIKNTKFYILSDVKNTLCGENGATKIFGPQKGLKDTDIESIEKWFYSFSKKLDSTYNSNISKLEGSGAAGGIGAALMCFTNAVVFCGIDKIIEIIKIEESIKNCDLVFTGEGRLDGQSIYGKAPIGIAKMAKKYNKPVVAIVGSTGEGYLDTLDYGVDLILDIIDKPMDFSEAASLSKSLLKNKAFMATKFFNNL